MERKFIWWKPFIQNLNKGFTLIELLVSLIVGGILLSLTFSLLVSNRKLYVEDINRTEVNQNLRAAIDIVGTDLKQAGERITEESFPVVEIRNISESRSEITVRLNSDLPVLRTCQNIAAGTSTAINIPAACSNTLEEIQQWQTYRCSLDGVSGCQGNAQEIVKAFIHDGSGQGEYFTYNNENTANLAITGSNNGTSWANNYSIDSTIYILEEHRYQLVDNKLQLVMDGNKTLNIVNGIQSFIVKASIPGIQPDPRTFPYIHTDGNTYRWWRLQSIKVDLQAINPSTGAFSVPQESLKVTGQFFPRNSLSR